jgi:sugar phosphate isomerase/epimerase
MDTFLHFGFSTLGCPEIDPTGLRALAAKHRSRWIEIRTLGGTTDFVDQLARFPGGAPALRDFFLESDVRVRLVGSSFLLTLSSESDRATLIAEAETGEALGAKWLRVFGGGECGNPLTPERAATATAHRIWWEALRAARGWNIDLIFETHGAFSSSPSILEFFAKTGGPMPLLWDTHHTWKIAGESAADSWSQLGAHIHHLHVKDSVSTPAPDGHAYTYVSPGRGEFPTDEVLTLLVHAGFDGVVSLEWEKKWHPFLASLDTILPDWTAATAAFRIHKHHTVSGDQPLLLLKTNFDNTQIVPSVGPYFHGPREQYKDILSTGPTSTALGDPSPANPRVGPLRIYYEGGNETQRFARLVPDEANPTNQILRFCISEPNSIVHRDTGPQYKSRVQGELYGNVELHDFYQKVRLRIPASLAVLREYPGEINWFTLAEYWNHTGWNNEPYTFRIGLHLEKPDPAVGTDLYLGVGSQHQVEAKTYVDQWKEHNHQVPVPFGEWITIETHFVEGDATTGRFWVAITPDGGDRTVLFDVHDVTHHPDNPAPTGLKQFCPIKLYTSGTLVNWLKDKGQALVVDWDELELWSGRTPEQSV